MNELDGLRLWTERNLCRAALGYLLEEFANVPDGVNVRVDEARDAIKRTDTVMATTGQNNTTIFHWMDSAEGEGVRDD
jgi:ABC-type transporter Mla subunit MlaD